PYFDGFRTLATNGVDKPVLNLFRMAGIMRGDRVKVESSGSAGLDAILKAGVRGAADVDGLATRADREVAVMVWNYHDDELAAPPTSVRVTVSGVPKALLEHYRIDNEHSNAYTLWKAMRSPQHPAAEQYAPLEAAGQLQLLVSPEWRDIADGKLTLEFSLPRHAVSLLRLCW